jgi:hypothetical protein
VPPRRRATACSPFDRVVRPLVGREHQVRKRRGFPRIGIAAEALPLGGFTPRLGIALRRGVTAQRENDQGGGYSGTWTALHAFSNAASVALCSAPTCARHV